MANSQTERRSFGKSLTAISVRTGIYGVVGFPIYAMVVSSAENKGFIQSFADERTAMFAMGFAIGGFIYGLGKEIWRGYKSRRIDRR